VTGNIVMESAGSAVITGVEYTDCLGTIVACAANVLWWSWMASGKLDTVKSC